ncbi:MAG: hypothetical protein IPK12_24995 [Gemmatimonadetes bacterium]|nr:hypothetical protein [Gemmatimonadota bacterium]
MRPSISFSPLACSGLVYTGVPTIMPVAGSFSAFPAHGAGGDAEVGHEDVAAVEQDVVVA